MADKDGVIKVYGKIDKGPNTIIRVQASMYEGNKYLHVREFFMGDDEEWHPTKKGFTFTEGDQVEDLIGLLQEAREDF